MPKSTRPINGIVIAVLPAALTATSGIAAKSGRIAFSH
jgi:hypothetical protein